MKISEQWLRESVATRLDTQALADRLTGAGIEIGAVTPVAPVLENVVVGKILSVVPHPQAERLRVCQVDVGTKAPLTIVCGAANAAPGLRVPAALDGAVLPNGTRISRANLRGVESAGMLCSAAELGLEESSDGLMILDSKSKPGMSITRLLQLNDNQIEVELTPNRGDCLSITGLARELSALTAAKLTATAIKPVAVKSKRKLRVVLGAKTACARYAGRVVEQINPLAKTPQWMRERLRRGGVRCIHPVVDITNYVMLELGQPMHAFDLSKVHGSIAARMARSGESLVLLDGKTVSLDQSDLVIADEKGPVALAGVMGGETSAVTDSTSDIFLESAWFRPENIGLRARHYGLHSESSHRFERGVDPALQRQALERATALVLEICGGRAGPVSEVISTAQLPKRAAITLRAKRMERLLGMSFPDVVAEGILKRLGMRVTRTGKKALERSWKVVPPSWRFDVAREVDLIEEIARVHGYDKVPVRMPDARLALAPIPESRVSESRLRSLLIDRDYQEAITYSFVDPALQSLVSPGQDAISLANPISSDLAQMRLTLWPGLIQAVLYNQNRQQQRVRLFECGRRFITRKGGGAEEQRVISGVATGPVSTEQWGLPARPVDFFDVKGDVEALLAAGGAGRFIFRPVAHPALHPGQAAEIIPSHGGDPIGVVGTIHPTLQRKFGLDKSAIVFEILTDPVTKGVVPIFRELSRYPAVRRDIAVILEDKIPAQVVVDSIVKTAGRLLVNLELFDEYRGEGIDSGRKSLALGLTFQDTSRTLNDSEVEIVVGRVVKALSDDFGGKLRE